MRWTILPGGSPWTARRPCVCVSVMFERKYCRLCGKAVKAPVTFLIEGSAIGEICQSKALLFAERVPDTLVAMWLGDLHGFSLRYDAVRTGRLARRRRAGFASFITPRSV